MLAALLISVAVLFASLGFFVYALSTMQRMLQEKHETEDRLLDSERHLQAIIDNTTSMVAVSDLEGRLVLVNRTFERVLTTTRIEAIGKSCTELFPEPVAIALEGRHADAVASSHAVEFELELPLASGPRWYAAAKFTLRDSAGRPYAVCSSFTDLTERRVLEQERRRIFDMSLDLMTVTGFDGIQRIANPQFTKVLGYSETELTSRPFTDFVHPDDREATLAAVSELERGDTLVDFENRGVCKDGSIQWLSWRVAPDPASDSMICVGRPIDGPTKQAAGAQPEPDESVEDAAVDVAAPDIPVPADRIVSLRPGKRSRKSH